MGEILGENQLRELEIVGLMRGLSQKLNGRNKEACDT